MPRLPRLTSAENVANDAATAARAEWRAAVDVLDAVVAQMDALPDPPRPGQVEKLSRRFEGAEAEASEARARTEQAERAAAEARDRAAGVHAAKRAFLPDTDPPEDRTMTQPQTRAAVTSEPLTYAPHSGASFFADLYAATRTGDFAARGRLERHQQEMATELRARPAAERRDLSSTDAVGGDFVTPLYLMDEWIAAPRAGRPFADISTRLPLPPNTDTLAVPRVVTGSATAAQADLGAVQETDPTTGTLSVPVKTIAGQVDVSRQLLDRSQPGMDEVLFTDLTADYNLRLDLQCLLGSGAGANAKGVLSDSNRIVLTYTDASPTVGEFYSRVADAAQQVATNTYMPATHIVMAPRRWAWIVAAQDTTGRPLVSPVAGQNSPGAFGAPNAQGIVGSLQGLQVVIDASMPTNGGAGTNEDTAIVTNARANFLWEAPPVPRIDESILSGNLGVRLQLYGYYAWTTERLSKSNATLTGTGLVAPAL